jgi:hypothetical protein
VDTVVLGLDGSDASKAAVCWCAQHLQTGRAMPGRSTGIARRRVSQRSSIRTCRWLALLSGRGCA